MHYRAKEFPLQNLIADADALMREMNRSMAAVDGHVDQNNLKDTGINYELVRDSYGDSSVRSTSLVGVENATLNTKLYGDAQNSSYEQQIETAKDQYTGYDDEAKRSRTWEYLKIDANTRMEISFSATETTYLHIVLNGQIELGKSTIASSLNRISEYEVRILLNNTPLDAYGSFSCKCNEGFMPFHVESMATVIPGSVSIRAQVRDKTPSPADGSTDADISLKLTNSYLFCYGHTR